MRISNASPSSFSVQIHDSVVCLRSLSEVQQKEKHIYCIPSVLVNNLVLRFPPLPSLRTVSPK